MREIVLDTETTGLDPKQGHRIIEVGALEIYNKVPTGCVFHYYINPERDVPYEAFQIHGISSEYLKDKPKFHEITDEFLAFIGDSKLVIHNAAFDMSFLNYELSKLSRPTIDFAKTIDTLQMARRQFPGQKNNLDALCRRFNINNSHRKYHGALKDASLLVEVYVELTGGRQVKLDVATKEQTQQSSSEKISYESLNLKIINPTDQELKDYEQMRNSLKL